MASTHEEKVVDRIDDLMAAHPALFAGRSFAISGPFLGAGWYAIADAMCLDIEAILGDEAHRFSPVQSKEKFGAWRFYWRLEPTPEEAAAQERAESFTLDLISPPDPAGVEKLDTGDDFQVSETPAGYRISLPPQGDLRRALYNRVRQAEKETESACMWCGAPATVWTTGWVHVACPKHRRRGAMTLEEAHRRFEERRSKTKRNDDADTE